MPKSIKDHLENTFEDLGEANLRKFKLKLRDRKEEPRVRQATIEKVQDALDLADLMVNTFTSTGAVPVTLEILEVIGCNQLATELRGNIGDEAPVVPGPGQGAPSAEQFIDRNWTALIARVNNVDAILDELLQKKVISLEDYTNIRAEKTKPNKMRELLTGPINSAGSRGKDALYQALKKSESFLFQELEAQGK
ncbi:Apoptosis-associated speck-like protein containing a CARD [Anabarilius grahami]|uniref:Apoptosis-associated speck-like protein containing a CARD n=1 Tax=Anabarilius grahami TaxID=495550 RepID=A0A3N0Y5I7_ANAGA|nr:Apoptosis-associated speck-like protein containing a CARD [Anabarilius grahami]